MNLPKLCVIGAQKSGTSTLHECLLSHRDILGPVDPTTTRPIKEVGFFNDKLWRQGKDWYRAHYASNDGCGLDSTPNYLCDYNAVARLRDVIPQARLVVSLREPVSRAYSQYNHYSQNVQKTRHWDWALPGQSFDQNVREELNSPGRHWFGIVGRGFYAAQLKRLLECFPREQVHVAIMERWVKNPDAYFAELLKFADLPQQRLEKKIAHVRQYTVEELGDVTADLLKETYRDSNNELRELLGDEIPEWN